MVMSLHGTLKEVCSSAFATSFITDTLYYLEIRIILCEFLQKYRISAP